MQHTDHGILSFWINLDYGGAGQGYGGYVLGASVAASLLDAVDRVFSKDWEKLPGTPCRAYVVNRKAVGIGHYLEDRWLWYSKKDNCFVVGSQFDLEEDNHD